SSGRALCYFPEETTSNGRGFLQFGDGLKSVEVDQGAEKVGARVHMIGIRYDVDRPSATFPHGSFLAHMASLLLSLSQHLTAHHLPPAEVKTLLPPSSEPTDEGPTASAVAQALGRILKLRRTGLGWRDKEEFVQFWREKGRVRKEGRGNKDDAGSTPTGRRGTGKKKL
ncbi:hypothetical protein HDU93_001188, partial [Gonapodya sp. JEL0774]